MDNKPWLILGGFIVTASLAILLYEAVSSSKLLEHTHNDVQQIVSQSSLDLLAETTMSVPIYDIEDQSAILPIPHEINVDKKQAKIGWLLFKDPNLSSNKRISCESCHSLSTNGAEHKDVSTGVGGKGSRNSLTIFNSAFNYRFFWDARVNSLREQIDGPIHNVLEMDSNWNVVTEYVSSSRRYSTLFNEANLDITKDTIKTVLIEFIRSLTTPNAPFDQYLLGDHSALSEQQVRGWESFQGEGCIGCHRGINIGGGMVMQFGVFGDGARGSERSIDTGRHFFTSKLEDMYLFRVASLRNVDKTAPYFHDGKTQSLEEAIKIMGESQLGKTLAPQTIDDIKSFLESLSGQPPAILEEFVNE